jgi:ADP-heptose:LPS heptosyltransferase
MAVLVHLASGVGNIVLSTPLLAALNEMGLTVDLRLSADYQAVASLFEGWSAIRSIVGDAPRLYEYESVLPAIPPFYWPRFARLYRKASNCAPRPPDHLFYEHEQDYYLAFARFLGYPADRRPEPYLPIAPSGAQGVGAATVVLAPGSKTGEMAFKRWPGFSQLAALLPDVAVVGTADDLLAADRSPLFFGPHVRNFAGRLTLRETAEVLASAGLVVANDTGLAHVAAAVGTPTLMLFGPTPDRTLGALPPHVTVLRSGLECEPCWFGNRFAHCRGRIDCLHELAVDRVARAALQYIEVLR